MNQKNFEYLHDQIKYTGFGEGLENNLKQKIEDGKPEFTIDYELLSECKFYALKYSLIYSLEYRYYLPLFDTRTKKILVNQ